VTNLLLLGGRLELALLATGGRLRVGVGVGVGVGTGGVGVGTGGVGVGTGGVGVGTGGVGVGTGGVGVGVRVVVTLAVLLTGEGSRVLELLLAVLLTSMPELGATKLTVLVTALAAPLTKLALGRKVTMPVVISYVPPETTTDVKPGTMLSVIVTFIAVLGPMFSVEIV
jgi:hypothetical protein